MNLKINLTKQKDRSYEIKFTTDTLSEINDFIAKNKKVKKVLFLTEKTVRKFHWKQLFSKLENQGNLKFFKYIFSPWEKNKNINTILEITQYLNKINFNRNDLVICFWWWVVWDMGWFLSSIYKRWVDFIQIPTTLLSILDSSVWWKTWVDFSWIKNIIWTFNQPKLVLVNSGYLDTLPEIQILSGYFEWFKHSLLDSEKHYNLWNAIYEQIMSDKKISNEILYDNISIKATVVINDEEEKNERKKLNFWHTFGHAIESLSDYSLPHWICVGYWIIFANLLAYNLGYLDNKNCNNINSLIFGMIKKYKLKKYKFEDIYEKMKNDKKNDNDMINFVLFKDFGNLVFEDIDKKQLKKNYDNFINFIH